jgi:hypothetical protein
MKKTFFCLCGALLLVLAGCSETPQSETKKAAQPAEPITGQTALYRMYQVARSWAPDAQVLKMNSILLTEVPMVRGKAGAWEATFTSADKSAARPYTYSVVEEEGNLHEGVFPGKEESWSGPANKPFLIAGVKIDTDAAYKTALKEAGEYDKKNPKQMISFLLERNEKFAEPVWRVIWGESVGTSGLSILIGASSGTWLETLH